MMSEHTTFSGVLLSALKTYEEQLEHQREQLQQIESGRDRLTEKLNKGLQKLNQMISRLNNYDQLCYVYLVQKQQYDYEIQMENSLELPCYRNRIFSINLKLVRNNQLVQNVNSILVEMQIWTYDKVPKKLSQNNHNQSIYKGIQQTVIKRGRGVLPRIQIREVSSHFPRGMFMLLFVPVEDGGVRGNVTHNEIRKEWIKPLIIQEVSIKAKKFSDRHVPYFAKSDGTIEIKS